MRKVLLLCVALLALTGASGATSEPTATVTVAITPTGFQPRVVAVDPGDTVVWRNSDTAEHQIVSNTSAFAASRVLKTNKTHSVRFDTPSAYSYHDGRKPSNEGTIIVRGPASGVTVGVSRTQLVYRGRVRVFGAVGNGRAGESVTVTTTRYSGPQVTKSLTTGDGGVFSDFDRPGIRSEYSASWRLGESRQAPFVQVRPLVVFNVLSVRKNLFFVRVRAARSYAGKVVRIQRLARNGAWVTSKTVRLNLKSQARVRGKFARGTTRARAWVGPAPGYIAGFSITKTVRR
jgi:plastocyanin